MSVHLTSDELKKFADNGVGQDAIRRTVETYRRDGWSDDAIRRKINDKLSMYDTTGLNEAQLNARAKLERGLATRADNPSASGPSTPMSPSEEQYFKNFFKKADQQRRMEKAREDVSTLPGAMRTSGERILNSATLGGYGALNNALGGNFDERNAAGQENLRKAGTVGKVINTASNIANDVGASLPAGGVAWNLAGRATAKPLARTVVSAAGLGGTAGFLNARGSIGDRLASGVVGAGVSAAMAPVFYGASKAIGKGMDYIGKRRANAADPDAKAMKTLARNVGGDDKLDDLIAQAKRDGVPLIDTGDINLEQTARTARTISPDANQRMDKYFQDQSNNAPSSASKMVDKFFGTKNTMQNAEELAKNLDPEANALYEMAFAGRTTSVPGSLKTHTAPARLPKAEFSRLDADPYIRDAINSAPGIHKELQVAGRKAVKDAAGNIIKYEPAAAPRNDMRRLDFAKEVLDNQINRELASPAPNTRLVASLTNAKNKLTASMDAYSPAYKSARAVSGKKLSALDAQKFGAKIDRADVSADAFVKRVADMTQTERNALRVGVRDYYKKGFEQATNPATFAKRLLDTDAQTKLRAVLGQDEANALIAQARNMVNRMNAKNFIMGGSRTAENLQAAQEGLSTAGELAAHPIRTLATKAAKIFDSRVLNNRYNQIADILLRDPALLKSPAGTVATQGASTSRAASPMLAAVLAGAMGNESGKAVQTGRDNMDDMEYMRLALRENGLDANGYDKYYHNKTQYENAQRGLKGLLSGQVAGLGAEIRDLPRTFKRTKYSVPKTVADLIGDLTFNKNGAIHGIMNDTPADKSPYLKSQKTKNMRLLEQILRGGN